MPITALPTPPLRTDPTNFAVRADAFLAALPTFATEANATAAAMNLNATTDTSASSVLIGTGSKSFTVSAAKSFQPGMWLTIAATASPTVNSMVGQVASYSGTALVVDVPSNGVFGSGTLTAWTIALTAAPSVAVSAAMAPVTSAVTLAAARAALDVPSTSQAKQTSAFRNRVINGDMAIDQAQLSTSATITAGAVLRRLCDQFYGYCTGANITAQQITFNGYNRERFTGAASNTGLGFATRLESNNVDDLVSNTATLSLRVSSTNITALTWTAYYANTTNVFGTLATPTRTQIATGTFTINSTDATYSAQMAVPAGAHTGIEIVFTTGALLGSQTIDFGDIQLEKGAVTTADTVFEVVEKGTQLARCQYHYERVVILVTATGSFVQQTSYRQKRAVPTLTIGSFSAGTGATFANLTQGGITSGLYQNANHSQVATADVYVDAGLF